MAGQQTPYFPTNPEKCLKLGSHFFETEDFEKALLYFSHSIKLLEKPGVTLKFDEEQKRVKNLATAHILRAHLYMNQSDPFNAEKEFTKSLDLLGVNAEAEIFTSRGTCFENMKDLDKALADYDKALSIEQQEHHALFRRGHVYSQKGKVQEANEDFSKALHIVVYHFVHLSRRKKHFKKEEDLKATCQEMENCIERGGNPSISRKYDPEEAETNVWDLIKFCPQDCQNPLKVSVVEGLRKQQKRKMRKQRKRQRQKKNRIKKRFEAEKEKTPETPRPSKTENPPSSTESLSAIETPTPQSETQKTSLSEKTETQKTECEHLTENGVESSENIILTSNGCSNSERNSLSSESTPNLSRQVVV